MDADARNTTTPQVATCGLRTSFATGTGSCIVWWLGTRSQTKPAIVTIDIAVTARNGMRMPPISYSQPPIRGPIVYGGRVPPRMMPVTRPRSSGANMSATSAKPTTHVIASAAPCTSRAVNSAGSSVAYANSSVDAANSTRPPRIGAFLPMRSDTAPIGIDTNSIVTPKLPNSRPMRVGDAPRRRLKSGSTGTAIENATMSVKHAAVTSATAADLDSRSDIAKSNDLFHEGTKDTKEGRVLAARLQVHTTERRNGEADGLIEAVRGDRIGVEASEVADVAAAV